MAAEMAMCRLVHALCIAALRPAALAVARRAAEFTTAYAAFPLHYPEVDFPWRSVPGSLPAACGISGILPPSLQQAEHARDLWAGYWRARPNARTGGIQLAQALVEVGKSRQALGRSDEAWTAFQEAVSVQRRVLDRSPDVEFHRILLGWCYDLLLDCGIRRGDWSGAAAALHEREKLWPNDSARLRKASHDYTALADAMARAGTGPTPDAPSLRRRLLAESDRCRRAAEAVSKPAEK